jgi:hypothetical protein
MINGVIIILFSIINNNITITFITAGIIIFLTIIFYCY